MPPGTLREGTQSIWHPCVCFSCPTQQEEEEEEARPGKHRDTRPRKEVPGRSLALANLDPQRGKKKQENQGYPQSQPRLGSVQRSLGFGTWIRRGQHPVLQGEGRVLRDIKQGLRLLSVGGGGSVTKDLKTCWQNGKLVALATVGPHFRF